MVSEKPATCRFVGQTKFSTGEWIGLELEKPIGKNNGMVQGVRYFECQPMYGVFVRVGAVAKLPAEEAAKAKAMTGGRRGDSSPAARARSPARLAGSKATGGREDLEDDQVGFALDRAVEELQRAIQLDDLGSPSSSSPGKPDLGGLIQTSGQLLGQAFGQLRDELQGAREREQQLRQKLRELGHVVAEPAPKTSFAGNGQPSDLDGLIQASGQLLGQAFGQLQEELDGARTQLAEARALERAR